MKTDLLAGWTAFLASPAAPATALQPIELEGYLAGLIVAPDLIPPSLWIEGLWGEAEPVFDSAEQAQAALASVTAYYNALIGKIDRQGATWKPMYIGHDGTADLEQCARWVNGFWKAMMFDAEAWLDLASDERTEILIEPFAVFADPDDPEEALPEDIDDLRRASAQIIPRLLPILRQLAQQRFSETGLAPRSAPKIGRNEPCPCGSGKKYKRCCGLN